VRGNDLKISNILGIDFFMTGRGSRARFEFDGRITAFHRPHPAKEAKPYQVEQARDFLTAIGVKP
jgi:hypothetical protein